jgi:hypothetical protein
MRIKKKGISPLLASITLISFSILAGTIFFGVMNGWFIGITKMTDISINAKIMGNYAIVDVKNVGNQQINLTSIKVDTAGASFSYQILNPGESFSPAINGTWALGTTFAVEVRYKSDGMEYIKYTKITPY